MFDRVIWNHLAAGRSLNVSSRRLVESVAALAPMAQEAGLMEAEAFKGFAVTAFVNHLTIERVHQAQMRKHAFKPMKHFWLIIYDVVAMRRIILFDQFRVSGLR